MSDKQQALDQLVSDATQLLQHTEAQLEQLALAAFTSYNTFGPGHDAPESKNDPDPNFEVVRRFQQIGQQLAGLLQHSNHLQNYLKNGLQTPPVESEQWPRIKILRSQEEERTQLARELEDSVGQLLANAVFELASCRHLLASGSESVSEGLDALQQELEQGLADIRHLITDLEPAAILGNFGLGGGIRRYLEQYQNRTGITTQLRINTNLGRLPGTVEVAIFRVLQEALQNVQQHANASLVAVEIFEDQDMVHFSVTDNGRGMSSDRVDGSKKNFGLAQMVDYASLINGNLRIFSEPGQGTRVMLSLPHHQL